MLLKPLLVPFFILIGLTEISCHKPGTGEKNTRPKETAGKTPRIVLSSPSECARQCKKGEPPKICYYRFNLELYPVLGEACKYCTPNSTNTIKSNCQCITANGVERIMLAVNRMLPGPSIQVCLGDKIVVDVVNNMEGMETSIHWHGQRQKKSQYYDGVPFLTQCPIPQGNTFRYQFIAADEGTHMWYSESGLQRLDGVHGSLIVRKPSCDDPNSSSYNHDLPEHVVVLSDWFLNQATERFPGTLNINLGRRTESVLINGKGQFTNPHTREVTASPSEVFIVKHGHKYRFRLINAFATLCPVEFTIQNHTVAVIATGVGPVRPRNVSTIIFSPGERFDIVVNANQHPASYWIQVRALGNCSTEKTQQTAILRYEGSSGKPKSEQPTYDEELSQKVVLDLLNCTLKRTNAPCISLLKNARPVDERIIAKKPDFKFYIAVNFSAYTSDLLYKADTYNPFLVFVPPVESLRTLPWVFQKSLPKSSLTSRVDVMITSHRQKYQFFNQRNVWTVTDSNRSIELFGFIGKVVPNNRRVLGTMNGISLVLPSSPPLSQIKNISPNTFCNADKPPANCGRPCRCTNVYKIPLGSVVELIIVDERQFAGLLLPFHMHGYFFNIMGMGHSPDTNVTKISAKCIRHLDSKHPLPRNYDRPVAKDTIVVPTNGYVILRFLADNPGYWLLQSQVVFHEVIGLGVVFHVGESSDLPPVPRDFPVCGNYKPLITSVKQGAKCRTVRT